MMLGWSTAAAARDSLMNRCRNASSGRAGGEDLERDPPVQAVVVGAVHHSHATLADLLLQPVTGHVGDPTPKSPGAAWFPSLTVPPDSLQISVPL